MAIVLDGTTGITTPDLTDTSLTSGRVVYAGTGGNLTGASTFTFDGSNLFVGGSSGTSRLAVANSTNDGTYNIKQYAVFGAATTYLDSDAANLWGSGLGEFQIQNGTATRPAMLSLGGSVNTDEGMGVINFFRSGNDDSYRARVQIAGVVGSTGTAGRHGGYLAIRVAADGQTDPAQVAQFNPSGTVILKGGTTSADGTGITFPATQSASSNANTLDDYEEGTAAVTYSTETSGTITVNTTQDLVAYTKVGRQVTITGQVQISSVSSPVGTFVHINGLPFASADLSELSGRVGGAVTFYDDSANTYTARGVLMLEGSTQMRLYQDASLVAANDGFIFSFSYFTT